MSHAFDPKARLILIEAEVSGPAGKAGAMLVLDTGATSTLLNASLLRTIGFDPAAASEFAQLTTGPTVAPVPRLMLNRLSALGKHAVGLRVLAHNLPPEAAVDGLLGLDFFREQVLTINFQLGQLTLTS